ncbi:MAG: hypothetical protein J7M38_16020, partial [Armatimonadetes bacterium]|nr:hypothetical protein [Armatimonadota bacterium]
MMKRKGGARLAPPHLQPPEKISCGADALISYRLAASPEILRRLCHREIFDMVASARERMIELEGRCCNGVRSIYDAVDTVSLSALTNLPSVLNFQGVNYLTGAGLPAFDNEVIDAYLTTPPLLRFNYIAYRRAIARLNPDVVRIPYTKTGVPVTLNPAMERYAEIAVRCGRAAVRSLRRLCGLSVPPVGEWPKIGEGMARCHEWHEVLRGRAGSSHMVELGLVDRAALHDIVEEQIAGRADYKEILGAWLTVEVWLEQSGSSQSRATAPASGWVRSLHYQ